MPSLKDLKLRIRSVKSTRKITSAMKMVAASKLRRAQEQAEAGRPYAERMERMMQSVAGGVSKDSAPALLTGTGTDTKVLLVLVTADRGLCGGFNTNAYRHARGLVRNLIGQGKSVKVLCVGRKGYDQMRREHPDLLLDPVTDYSRPRVEFATARGVMERITEMFALGELDVCHLVFNEFRSVISQKPLDSQIVPLDLSDDGSDDQAAETAESAETKAGPRVEYDFEPDEAELLEKLLPLNLSIQIYRAMLESAAGEQAARMTAMDNATRNAGDMIDRLTLEYNRTRQAYITKELIEIISGAEAL